MNVTTGEIRPARENVVVMGAGGAAGTRIARQLAARGVQLTLAGRHRASLAPLADELEADILEADVTRPDQVVRRAELVVNTVGPFTTLAGAMAEACLNAGVAYVDIASELGAATRVLALAERARAHGSVLVTGAGFGPAVTEALLLGLLPTLTGPPAAVRVAAAPATEGISAGVQATLAMTAAEGTAWYADGILTRAPQAAGGFRMVLAGHPWRMTPAPAADLEAARRASGAADVIAYSAIPGQPAAAGGISYAYAEAQDLSGTTAAYLATLGPSLQVTATIAAETACRILECHPRVRAGAWTPGALFGPGLVRDACDITITPAAPARPSGGGHRRFTIWNRERRHRSPLW
jgi:saccharopine dehydrogenase (NAD+, L-lysine-forming)